MAESSALAIDMAFFKEFDTDLTLHGVQCRATTSFRFMETQCGIGRLSPRYGTSDRGVRNVSLRNLNVGSLRDIIPPGLTVTGQSALSRRLYSIWSIFIRSITLVVPRFEKRCMRTGTCCSKYPGRWRMVMYGLKNTKAQKADSAEPEDFVEIELTAVNGTDEIHVHRTTKD